MHLSGWRACPPAQEIKVSQVLHLQLSMQRYPIRSCGLSTSCALALRPVRCTTCRGQCKRSVCRRLKRCPGLGRLVAPTPQYAIITMCS